MGRRKEGADKEEDDDQERGRVGGVDRGNEAGARRGTGTCQGEEGTVTEWRVAARARNDRGACLACFPPLVCLPCPCSPVSSSFLPSPKLELDPRRPRSGGNELDLDWGGARIGGWKLDPSSKRSNREVRS